MNTALLSLVTYYSSLYGLDPRLVQAIIQQESGWNEHSVGLLGEVGLMQLRPEYFPYGVEYLKKASNNVALGVKHLADVKKQCAHQEDNTFIVCFNAGVAGAKKIKHPKQFKYYKEVMKVYSNLEKGN